MSRAELRFAADAGDQVCPFLVAACLVSGNAIEGNAECWREKCQLWIPNHLSCGLEALRLEQSK